MDGPTLIPNTLLFNKTSIGGQPFRRHDPLHGINVSQITYKNYTVLEKFVSEGGRILAARITGLCAKKQRAVARQIKIIRFLAIPMKIQ